MHRRIWIALMAVTALTVGASCSGDDDEATVRYAVALDVAVPDELGGWTRDKPGSDLCTVDDFEAFAFSASSADGDNLLVEPFGDELRRPMPLGAVSGKVVDGACQSLLVLDVSSDMTVTVEATYSGAAAGTIETDPVEVSPGSGLLGRRSPGSPWRLTP